MTGGFATIAGTVLAAFINFGIDPALLISASVMAAPAALGFSKLFYPETEKSKVTSRYRNPPHFLFLIRFKKRYFIDRFV